MTTTQEEKPAKPRQRNRKADQKTPKAEQKAKAKAASEQVSLSVAPAEVPPVELAQVEVAQVEAELVEAVAVDVAPAPVVTEKLDETPLTGEVLLPEVQKPAPQAAGLPAIAQAYGEYTRKSWLTGRVLVERLATARSFNEAVEIQGEFARQACANFAVQSQKICQLYGEWAQQSFRPFASEWSRLGR